MERVANRSEPSELRYERKFLVENLSPHVVEHIIRQNPACFASSYPDRAVNNIYLDTLNLQSFSDNVEGIARRCKFRIRWYGNKIGLVRNPVLEYKFKDNAAGGKEHYPLADFDLNRNFSSSTIDRVLSESVIPDMLRYRLGKVGPTLLNSYNRKYYLSINRKFRLTLDRQLRYISLGGRNNMLMNERVDRNSLVVELKYPVSLDSDAREITNHFPFRMTKNSKYVTGLSQLRL